MERKTNETDRILLGGEEKKMSKAWIVPILLISIGSMITAWNVAWNAKMIEDLRARVDRLQSIVDGLQHVTDGMLRMLKETRR